MEKEGHDVYIAVTTDEQPFIDFLVEKFNDKVLYYKEGLRSTANTSGMKENFEKIIQEIKRLMFLIYQMMNKNL